MTRWQRRLAILATVLVAGACSAPPSSSSPAAPTSLPWPSSADLGTIRGLIISRAGDELTSIGFGGGTVIVGLRAGAVDLAKQIVDAYGAAVEVTVGFFRYPSGALVDGACAVPGTLSDNAALRATVEMASLRITSGTTFDPTVRITDIGTASVTVQTSNSLEVYLFRPGGTKPVGAFDLGVAGMGLETSVEPAKSITIPGYGGTASCDISLGYTLAPGPYQARALVDFAIGPEGGNGPHVFWSDPLDVEIVPAP